MSRRQPFGLTNTFFYSFFSVCFLFLNIRFGWSFFIYDGETFYLNGLSLILASKTIMTTCLPTLINIYKHIYKQDIHTILCFRKLNLKDLDKDTVIVIPTPGWVTDITIYIYTSGVLISIMQGPQLIMIWLSSQIHI